MVFGGKTRPQAPLGRVILPSNQCVYASFVYGMSCHFNFLRNDQMSCVVERPLTIIKKRTDLSPCLSALRFLFLYYSFFLPLTAVRFLNDVFSRSVSVVWLPFNNTKPVLHKRSSFYLPSTKYTGRKVEWNLKAKRIWWKNSEGARFFFLMRLSNSFHQV